MARQVRLSGRHRAGGKSHVHDSRISRSGCARGRGISATKRVQPSLSLGQSGPQQSCFMARKRKAGSCWPLQPACARWLEVSGQSLPCVCCRARPWQASPQHFGSTGSIEWSSLHTVSLFLSPSIHTHSPTTHTHIDVVTAPLHWQVSHGQEGHRHVWLRHLVRCHWVGVRTLPCCMRLFVPLCSTHSPCSLAGARQHPEKFLT